ncbi:hypothetical protein C8R45DRAFT_1079670 [Mycena sanguinolenta]|nr:hypothetical protein C8R45DRAFT_1079670 [Mycena sanguinolenta]
MCHTTPPRSHSAPPATGTAQTCVHRCADCPHLNSDLSVPSTVPNTRSRPGNCRRDIAPSQTSVADTSKDGSQHKRAQTNADRPAKRARKEPSSVDNSDGPAVRNQSTANTRFNRRQTSNVATGSRVRTSSARPGTNHSQVDVNQRMELSNFSGTGGTGGAGGFGGLIGGTGGNGQGTVFNMNIVFNFPR